MTVITPVAPVKSVPRITELSIEEAIDRKLAGLTLAPLETVEPTAGHDPRMIEVGKGYQSPHSSARNFERFKFSSFFYLQQEPSNGKLLLEEAERDVRLEAEAGLLHTPRRRSSSIPLPGA